MVIKPAEREDRVTPTANRRSLSLKQLLLFLIVSILVHGLGLLLFASDRRSPITAENTESKPIEFVVVPEESEVEPPPETEKRATEDSVAEPDTEPEETTQNDRDPMPVPATESEPTPEPTPQPEATSEPELEPTPEPAPQPENPPANDPPPVLSDSDPAATPIPEPTPEPNSDSVATNLPPQTIPEPEPPQTALTNPEGSASDLLGGSYERTLADGGGDAFFSPEALAFNAVLNPEQQAALKKFNSEEYFAEVLEQMRNNLSNTASEILATELSIKILQNGQLDKININKSSGSKDFDDRALDTVRKSAPFKPLPPEFPLDSLELEFVIYTDFERR